MYVSVCVCVRECRMDEQRWLRMMQGTESHRLWWPTETMSRLILMPNVCCLHIQFLIVLHHKLLVDKTGLRCVKSLTVLFFSAWDGRCFLCPSVFTFSLILQVVGVAARQGRVWNSANTVVKVKQLLGRRFLLMFCIINSEFSRTK